MDLSIITTRYNRRTADTKHEHFYVHKLINGVIKCIKVTTLHRCTTSYENEKQLKKDEITIVESQFDNYFLYIASLLGNFKNSNREYDYLEVEFHGFEDGKRIDLEYKIELKDKSRYEIYTKMEQMMNSYFDPKENVESVLEFALDVNGKKIISFEPIDDLIKPVMKGGKKIAKLTVDELAENNLINDKVAKAMDEKLSEIMETMSSVSHSSGKRFRKRKKLFGIL